MNITNNIVHDNVKNGIFVGRFDFATIEGNTVYGNVARGGSSGIHLKAAYNITGSNSNDGYRIIVRDNVSYDNVTEYGMRTDGNGISLDDFRNTQIPSLPSYEFKSLVEDNIVYSNTGRGIQVAWTDYATIRDNISFYNNADGRTGPWLNELSNMGSSNNTWTGNIAVTDRGNPAIGNLTFNGDPANKNVSWHNNTTFNGTRGDESVYANAGNSKPTIADGNKLGSDPGLSLSEVKAMGAALTGSGVLPAPAVPDVDGGTDGPDGGGPQPPAPTTPTTPSADLAGLATPQSPAFYAELARKLGVTLKIGNGDAGDNLVLANAAGVARGNDGDDILVGNNGGGILYGGAGNNVHAELGGADTFYFSGAWVGGSKVDTILDLDFAERDVIVLRGYDKGTFEAAPGLAVFDGGGSATVNSLADLRALVAGSDAVTSRTGGGGAEVLRIVQDGAVHEVRLEGYDHLL